MKVAVRTKEGKTKQVEKEVAQKMIEKGEAEYTDPHIPNKNPQGYQTK